MSELHCDMTEEVNEIKIEEEVMSELHLEHNGDMTEDVNELKIEPTEEVVTDCSEENSTKSDECESIPVDIDDMIVETIEDEKDIIVTEDSVEDVSQPLENPEVPESPISQVTDTSESVPSSSTSLKRPASVSFDLHKQSPSKVIITQGSGGKPILLPKVSGATATIIQSPVKTITFAQARQLGLISPIKSQNEGSGGNSSPPIKRIIRIPSSSPARVSSSIGHRVHVIPGSKVQYVKALSPSNKTEAVSTSPDSKNFSPSKNATIIISNGSSSNRYILNRTKVITSPLQRNTVLLSKVKNKDAGDAVGNRVVVTQSLSEVKEIPSDNDETKNMLRASGTVKLVPALLSDVLKPGQRVVISSNQDTNNPNMSDENSDTPIQKRTGNVYILPAPTQSEKDKSEEDKTSLKKDISEHLVVTSNKEEEGEGSEANVPKTDNANTNDDSKIRKPCNCTKSGCLKLYCECFASGEFCSECNCVSCFNTPEFEEHREHAIRSCLTRNPKAFHPKILKFVPGDSEKLHAKGCHCKKSNCLKNYCECFEAKVTCSANCKCVNCKNGNDDVKKPVRDMVVTDIDPIRDRLTDQMSLVQKLDKDVDPRYAFSFLSDEMIESISQCLLAQASEIEHEIGASKEEKEKAIVDEFGRCITQLITTIRPTPPKNPPKKIEQTNTQPELVTIKEEPPDRDNFYMNYIMTALHKQAQEGVL